MDIFKKPFRIVCLIVWLLLMTLFLPPPLKRVAASGEDSVNAHVLRRLNSPERRAAIEEVARLEAAASEAQARSEGSGAALVVSPESRIQGTTVPWQENSKEGRDSSFSAGEVTSSHPQSVNEILFNYGASFMGVPGLAPKRRGMDEGLGFHQDGTVRKAGGTSGHFDPSGRGQRARTHMQSGPRDRDSLFDPDDLFDMMGRNDPTRGGRISRTNGYSRGLGDFDPMNTAIDRGLNYGAGLLNSAGEAALSGLVDDGRARLNFRLDKDGYFNGEGDALLPFYDSRYTTIFTQLGARSMQDADKDRWIGNFGLGQRWFPAADEENAGNWMLGYNVFLDYDFTRDHQRGGMGVEAQYDWLSLASNYYVPLSDWKGSEDFDSAFVKERAAEGWDVRAKGYLPFYRHIAVTGAYSQWSGDHVGVFGSDSLENDPNVWSYGLEYTPVPLVSGFVTQRSTERGNTDTEFGLNFTYHFQMPWEDQIAPAEVAALRTVSGSRHEFVDRENRIILEYKTKNAYRIEYVGPNGNEINEFVFRVRDGFNKYKAE